MMIRTMTGIAAVAALVCSLNVAAFAEETQPDATLRLSGGSVAAGIGVNWGSGTLTYKGTDYPVDVTGFSVGDVGMTKIEAAGTVHNLKDLKNFDGNYTGVGAGAALAGGASAVTVKNQNGVTADLISTTQGVKIMLGGGGISMKIKK
jgi:hypothetical protein